MQTHITIAIAITMMSLFALMFWQTVIDARRTMLLWPVLN
jgi:hypothetical protein